MRCHDHCSNPNCFKSNTVHSGVRRGCICTMMCKENTCYFNDPVNLMQSIKHEVYYYPHTMGLNTPLKVGFKWASSVINLIYGHACALAGKQTCKMHACEHTQTYPVTGTNTVAIMRAHTVSLLHVFFLCEHLCKSDSMPTSMLCCHSVPAAWFMVVRDV